MPLNFGKYYKLYRPERVAQPNRLIFGANEIIVLYIFYLQSSDVPVYGLRPVSGEISGHVSDSDVHARPVSRSHDVALCWRASVTSGGARCVTIRWKTRDDIQAPWLMNYALHRTTPCDKI